MWSTAEGAFVKINKCLMTVERAVSVQKSLHCWVFTALAGLLHQARVLVICRDVMHGLYVCPLTGPPCVTFFESRTVVSLRADNDPARHSRSFCY